MDDNKVKPDKEIERKNAKQERLKSNVRIWITYGAGVYIFLGSILLMLYGICNKETNTENFRITKDIFMLVFPIATGIITYWFSTRSNRRNDNGTNGNNNQTSQ